MAKTKGRKKRTQSKWHQQRKNALARRNRRNARLAEKREIAKTKGRKKRTTSKKGRKSRRKRRRVRINKDGTVNKQDLKLPSLASMMRDNPGLKMKSGKLY